MNDEALPIDIAIVGGGMVGLSAALALAHVGRKKKIVLIDPSLAQPLGPSAASWRVVALHEGNVAMLDRLGVPVKNPSVSIPFASMHLSDVVLKRSFDITADDAKTASLGRIADVNALLNALKKRVTDCPEIQCVASKVSKVQLEAGAARLEIASGTHYRASLLLAADGKDSSVRSQLGCAVHTTPYPHEVWTACFQHCLAHGGQVRQMFFESGTLALLPTPDEHHSVAVYAQASDRLDAFEQMSQEEQITQIDHLLEHPHGGLTLRLSSARMPVAARSMPMLYRGRCMFVGDAAHTVHPMAGLGGNAGLSDVAELASEIGALWARDRPIRMSALEGVARRRQMAHRALHAGIQHCLALWSPGALGSRMLRRIVWGALARSSLLRAAMEWSARQV